MAPRWTFPQVQAVRVVDRKMLVGENQGIRPVPDLPREAPRSPQEARRPGGTRPRRSAGVPEAPAGFWAVPRPVPVGGWFEFG